MNEKPKDVPQFEPVPDDAPQATWDDDDETDEEVEEDDDDGG